MKHTTFDLSDEVKMCIARYLNKAYAAVRSVQDKIHVAPLHPNMASGLLTGADGYWTIHDDYKELYFKEIAFEPFEPAYGVDVCLIITGCIRGFDQSKPPIPVVGRMRFRIHFDDFTTTKLYLREV